jgi:hypothetical protein
MDSYSPRNSRERKLMTKELTLQELINEVKRDLFSPYAGTDKQGKIAYPLFFVDRVELDLEVELTYDAEAGLKITIPQVVEGTVTGGQGKTKTHTVKVSLSPILSREEQRALLEQDERMMTGIRSASTMALRKGVDLAGEED